MYKQLFEHSVATCIKVLIQHLLLQFELSVVAKLRLLVASSVIALIIAEYTFPYERRARNTGRALHGWWREIIAFPIPVT